MPERVLALCGPGQGPKVPLRSSRPAITISGLRPNEAVRITVEADSVTIETFELDGSYRLPAGRFVSCHYEGTNKSLMCFVKD